MTALSEVTRGWAPAELRAATAGLPRADRERMRRRLVSALNSRDVVDALFPKPRGESQPRPAPPPPPRPRGRR